MNQAKNTTRVDEQTRFPGDDRPQTHSGNGGGTDVEGTRQSSAGAPPGRAPAGEASASTAEATRDPAEAAASATESGQQAVGAASASAADSTQPVEGAGPVALLGAATQERVRFEEFARVVRGKERVLVLTHDNPDPDAMASAIGIYTILTKTFGIDALIGHGGIIARAENKAMVKNLDLPIYSLPLLGDLQQFDGVVLVDCQVEAKYHSLPRGIVPLAVFDHHPPISESPTGLFVELRPEAGATSTIITKYLLASGVPISPTVATALMYGIRSDTSDFCRNCFVWDIEAHQALFPLVDRALLAEIENPPLPREYFVELRRALDRAKVYGRAVTVDMGHLENPDMVPLVADLLLRLDTAVWAMVYGWYEKEIRISLRCDDPGGDAGRIVRKMVRRRGSGGGHGEMAAAQIPLTASHPEVQYDILIGDYLRAFLELIGESDHGTPLCRSRKSTASSG